MGDTMAGIPWGTSNSPGIWGEGAGLEQETGDFRRASRVSSEQAEQGWPRMAKEQLVRDVKVERSLGCRAHGTVNLSTLREVTNTKSSIKSLNFREQILGCSGICLVKSHMRCLWRPRRPEHLDSYGVRLSVDTQHQPQNCLDADWADK